MKLLLAGFSQDVDLTDPSQILYFLVFQSEDGRSLRLPTTKEATEKLVDFVYVPPKGTLVKSAEELPTNMQSVGAHEDDEFQDATVFGSEEAADGGFEDEHNVPGDDFDDEGTPMSEDEVPSL